MTRFFSILGAKQAFCAVSLLLVCNGSAHSETMEWKIQNVTNLPLGAILFSKSRPVAWPGNNLAYLIPNDRRMYSVPLSCIRDEMLCYGAWVTDNPNLSWGVGPWNLSGCPSCCYICREGTFVQASLDRAGCRAGPSLGSLPPILPGKTLVTVSGAFQVAGPATNCDVVVDTKPPTPGPEEVCDRNVPDYCELRNTPLPRRQ
jgi:hypothetical protein